jgi:hypothetical protein
MAPKPRLGLLPVGALCQVAEVLTYGASKYSANNWARGTEWSRYYDALQRHLFAWWAGEAGDPETGASHLAHAGCCLLFLLEYERNGWGCDDRFRGPDAAPFTKHDGRAAAPAPARPQQQACWITPDGTQACAPADRRIHDDDDGLE